ncbi:hypothetical protein HK104_009203 [Borealophlyctis nickersoniae]|nr:hypothetical protein HK104_009203 [Borealophlyctis nickersoniae]
MFSFLSSTWNALSYSSPDDFSDSEQQGYVSSTSLTDDSDSDGSLDSLGGLEELDLVKRILDEVEDGIDWQHPYEPGRNWSEGMPSLFLSEVLVGREEKEKLKHDVLRARLGELVFAREFARAYGKNAVGITATPLAQIAKGDTSFRSAKPGDPRRNYSSIEIPGPGIMPPLTRAIYVRMVREMPIFGGQGENFIKELDKVVETVFIDFVAKWMRATKFDVLGFTRFYGSLLSHIKNEVWCDGKNGPTPTELYPALLAWQRAAQPGGGSFRLSKRHRRLDGSLDDERLLRYREEKMSRFINAWRVFLKSAVVCLRDLKEARLLDSGDDDQDYAYAEALLGKIREAPTIYNMSDIYQDCFEAILDVLANMIDCILDDQEWRHKFESIVNKLPLNFILATMRIVNPIPFMNRVIRIFCWKPPGGYYSLLQRIGALITSLSKTETALAAFHPRIKVNRRAAIDAAVAEAYESGDFTSHDSADRVLTLLAEYATLENVSDLEVAYTKLAIRKREKLVFIEALGSEDVSKFVVMVCSVLPPILSEIWECTDFATLLSNFFDTIRSVLGALSPYDKYPRNTIPPSTVPETVTKNVAEALIPFFEAFYSFLHTLSTHKPKGPAGLHAMIDWVIRQSIGSSKELETGPNTQNRASLMDLAKDVQNVDPRVWQEVEMVIELMERGVDERLWPEMPLLCGDLLKINMGDAVREFVGDGGVDEQYGGRSVVLPKSSAEPLEIDDVE